MHVVMTTDATGSSGVWSYSLTLAAALRRRGIGVTLVSLGPPPSVRQAAGVPAGVRLIPADYKLEWQENLNGAVALSGAFIARLIDDLRPEIFHSNHYCYGALSIGAAKVVVAHNDRLSWLTWCRHGGDARQLIVPSHLADYQAFVEEGLSGADVVVCPSAFMAHTLMDHYRARPRTIVIPNGVEPPAAPPLPRPDGRPLTAVIAGRLWDEAKNVDLAIAAIHRTTAPTRLLAVGPTTSPDGLERPVRADDRVEPLGLLVTEEVERAYRRSDVYLAVSCYEPFGLGPLEAALAGCAVVCNDLPSYREVWDDVAIFCRRNDPSDLAAALDELAADPDGLRERQALARARALDFTADAMADKYVALYRRLVDRSPARVVGAGVQGGLEGTAF
jgi:glycosyltransferase involved in cell wall biosynthesis